MLSHPLNLSDHCAIYASLSIPIPSLRNTISSSLSSHRSSSSKLAWFKLDEQSILTSYTREVEFQLSTISLNVVSPEDIDLTVTRLSDILINAGKAHIPTCSYKPHVRHRWPQSVSNAHSFSKESYRNWVRAGKPTDPSHPLKRAYKDAKRAFRRELRILNREELEEFYLSLDPSDPNIFQMVRQKLGSNSPQTDILIVNGTSFTQDGIPEGWAQYFGALYTPSSNISNIDHHSFVSSEIQKILQSRCWCSDEIIFSPDDITEIICSLPKKKASGPDYISMEHIIYAPLHILSALLANLFNAILRCHYVPSSFCTSIILPLFKGGSKNPSDPGSYRGISLSSNLSKVFEHALLPLLSSKLLPLIHPLQGGFRPGFSTFHTSFILNEATIECKTTHSIAFQAFLDVKKAFDSVWHDGLFFKLLGIHSDIWFTLYNWYNRLSASVRWCSSISRSFPVKQGVRQGAVLSPLLYAVFTSDLLFELEQSSLGAFIGSIYCGAPTYADDMTLVSHSPTELQDMLDIVTSYARTWEYSINSTKSQIVICCNKPSVRSALSDNFHWSVCDSVIPIAESTKHLGVLLSSSQSTISRTSGRITSSRSAFYALSAAGARHTCINSLTSLQLYKSLSLPILLFGLEVWSPTNTELMMMERSQLKILRTILGLPSRSSSSGIHFLLGTLPIQYHALLKLLSFTRSTVALPPHSIARQILLFRSSQNNPPSRSIVNNIISTLDNLCLPNLEVLLNNPPTKKVWKALTKTMVFESFREVSFFDSSPSPTLVDLLRISPPKYGVPIDVLQIFKHDLKLARLSLLRIRLLLHVSSLNSHTCSFRVTDRFSIRSDRCQLCQLAATEDLLHFLSVCPALQPVRDLWLPKIYGSTTPSNHDIVDHVLGIACLDSLDQLLILQFLADLYAYRSNLILG